MNDINQIKQALIVMTNSSNVDFANTAQFLLQVIAQVEQNAMSIGEATETIKDIQRQLNLVQASESLDSKEQLNTILNGLMTLAGVI